MRPYYVAIVGAGPSGYFAAASLLKFADGSVAGGGPDVRVDMLEMLPTPWGLVRSGVAPDHPKIKSISKTFEKTSSDPRFRFFGNITVGEDVSAQELTDRYDAVVYAVGAQSDRALHIPGEDWPEASRPSTSSAGTTPIRTSRRWPRTSPAAAPWSSVSATSHSTCPDSGQRSRGAGQHRHRRPRPEVPARPRRRGGGDPGPARSPAIDLHHPGVA